MMGWKCPGCGRCYAPFVGQCSVCGPSIPATGTWPPRPIPGTAIPPTPYIRPDNTCSQVPPEGAGLLRRRERS